MAQNVSEPKKALKRKTLDGDYNHDDYDDVLDRLSALPDGVLCHILSFLRTEEAAATSILSTRWRNLFVSLPDIDLRACVVRDHTNSETDADFLHSSFMKFINFALRVLKLRNGAPIRRFKLSLWPFGERFRLGIDLLISAALSFKLQELEVVWNSDDTRKLSPLGMFTCKTLVSLKLSRDDVDLVVPHSVSLPSLKVLHLKGLRLVDRNSIRRLIKGCPLLEELNFFLCSNVVGGVTMVRLLYLSSPSLKKLILWGFGGEYYIVVDSENLDYLEFRVRRTHDITLNAPNLKCFIYDSYAVEVYLIRDLISLVRAEIRIQFVDDRITERSLCVHDAFELINGLRNVKTLYLYQHSLQALYYSGWVLPTFRNLTTLSLEASEYEDFDHSHLWKTLPSLLANASQLEVLIFHEVFKNNFGGVEEFERILPEVIPLCSVEHLREIEIRKFKGNKHEFKLLEYFLQYGICLRKMALFGVRKPSKSASEGWNRILSLKRCSKDCQFVFKESE